MEVTLTRTLTIAFVVLAMIGLCYLAQYLLATIGFWFLIPWFSVLFFLAWRLD